MMDGWLKRLDVVKIVGAGGDRDKGILSLRSMSRPKSIQIEKPIVMGHPQPLANVRLVSQRRQKETEISTPSSDNITTDSREK